MTDENANTADLTDGEKLSLILQRLNAIEAEAEERSDSMRALLERIIHEVRDTQKVLPKLELIHADARADMRSLLRELEALGSGARLERPEPTRTPDRASEVERFLDEALRLPISDLELLIERLKVEWDRQKELAAKRLLDKLG